MKRTKRWNFTWVRGLLDVGPVGLILAVQRLADAQGEQVTHSQKSESNAAIEKKLEQLLANQDTMLKKLDSIQNELQIVKIRCTR